MSLPVLTAMAQHPGSGRVTAKSHFLKELDIQSLLVGEPEGFCGIKMVATIGPACHEVKDLVELLDAGAVGARVDLTWGGLSFHRESLLNLQQAMRDTRKLCCVMVDTLGREVMIRRQVKLDEQGWPVHEESFNVVAGQQVILTTRPEAVATDNVLPITYPRFSEMTEPGDTIYIGRYLVCGADVASLYLEVQEVNGPDVVCVAKNDAVLDGLLTVFHTERSSAQMVSVSNVQNALPLLSEYDQEAIKALAQEFELDFISLSYTRCEDDVHEARAFLSSIGCVNTRVLAKIETRQALINFDGILSAADGIIISRGNLGLDNPPEKMAMIQKTLIQMCNLAGKPALITRVVDTMVNSPRPTRAEATDVANATLDGVDGIVLGAETLRGKFPAECVRTICRICRAAEKVFDHEYHYDFIMAQALLEEETRAMEAAQLATGSGADLLEWGQVPVAGGRLHATAAAAAAAADVSGALPDAAVPNGLLAASGSPDVSANGSLYKSTLAAEANASSYGSTLSHLKKSGAPRHVSLSHMSKASGLYNMVPAGGSFPHLSAAGLQSLKGHAPWRSPYLSKLESIASSAVKVADKVRASLMVVYTHTGATAQLVAKYRPPVPILTLVVPNLCSDGLTWKLQGRCFARQCLLSRSLLPVLINPSASGDESMNQAAEYAACMGITRANDHIVCVQRSHMDFCVKVLSVEQVLGLKPQRRAFGDSPAFNQLPGASKLPQNTSFPFASSPSLAYRVPIGPTGSMLLDALPENM